jgi:hypothetical protein
VNTYTTGFQGFPAVASDSSGHFIVVWESDSQDGSTGGVFGRVSCPPLASVGIAVNGSTAVCPRATGGTATVTDGDGGTRTHQWGYRTASLGPTTPISGATAIAYLIDGADFPGAGLYYLVCFAISDCQAPVPSNEVAIIVDLSAPSVSPPNPMATAQTLCM